MSTATDIAFTPHGARFGPGHVLLWAGAALLVVGAHAGAAIWATRQAPDMPAEAGAPAAIMMELAPVAMAPEAVEDEIAPDMYDAPEIAAAPPQELTEPPADMTPVPPQLTAMTPPPPLEPPPSPVEMPVTDALPVLEPAPVPPPVAPIETVEAEVVEPRPVARPQDLPRVTPPEPARTAERTPERERPQVQPAAPSQAAQQARLQSAAPAPTAAAPQASSGQRSESPARWQSRLMAHLERHKRYPAAARQRRQEGTVLVRFAIDGGGNVQSVQLARSSGHTELDEAVLTLVRRASPMPAPPPEAPRDITAPVRFQIR